MKDTEIVQIQKRKIEERGMKRQKLFFLFHSIGEFLIIPQQLRGTIAFHKKVTMKTLHRQQERRETIWNYTPTRQIIL